MSQSSWPPAEVVVLVTGVGAPGIAGTVHSIRENFDNVPTVIIGTDIAASPVGRHLVDAFVSVPPPEDQGYIDAMLKACHVHHVQVVLPQTTRETSLLSQRRRQFEDTGTSVVVGDAEAVLTGNDKFQTLEAFRAHGLSTPRYRLVTMAEGLVTAAKELGYPEEELVAKVPTSSGMRGLRILTERPDSFDDFLNEKPSVQHSTLNQFSEMCRGSDTFTPILLSEYLPGQEFSVDAFVGHQVSVAIPRRRDVIRSGISFVTTVIDDAYLESQTLSGAAALGLRGLFGFQFKQDVFGHPRVLECNPRVQGTMVAATLSGVNLIWMAIRERLGATCVDIAKPRVGTVLRRYWGSVGETPEGTVKL